ncbi:unnamed protein product [Dibothriocephalus latus]|uniref:Uncharacterized protein n=1 Tax=Dibothriocephalus latus TaxID=60516 RepID=A0A3P7LJF3_DIBLA|nr:unnamed protein product [Dibothriocephalus latus]
MCRSIGDIAPKISIANSVELILRISIFMGLDFHGLRTDDRLTKFELCECSLSKWTVPCPPRSSRLLLNEVIVGSEVFNCLMFDLLFRGPPSSVLSSETLIKKLKDIWQKACSSKTPLRLSNYLFLWATAGLDASAPSIQAKRELSWLNVSAVLPNAPFLLRKIRSYPFDADYLRFCLQTELAVEKFKHLDPVDSNGEFSDYRFGFFLMDSSGCLVPYLDGDPILESSTIAGV